jgi:hypothetical protein
MRHFVRVDTGSLKTHPLPPNGFNPRAASPLELRRYGLPQRPDPAIRPELAARWDEIFSRKLTYVTPAFRPMQELLPGIERQGRPRQDLVTVTHSFWSGGVVHATGSEAFTWVLGQWNVPDVAPAAKGQGSWYSIALDRYRRKLGCHSDRHVAVRIDRRER